MCLEQPDLYDGRTIIVGNEATVSKVTEDGFFIRQMGKEVRVFSAERNVRPGEFVILKAIFHKPNTLHVIQLRVAKKRRAKIWLSVIPVIFVGIYFFRRFRFNFTTLYFEERS